MAYKQSGDLIYDENVGMVCQLSDPTTNYIEHKKVSLQGEVWAKAMTNAKRIIEAEECLTLCRLAWGEDWRQELEALIEIARAM